MRLYLIAGAVLLTGLAAATAQDGSKDAIRKKLKDTNVHPSWIYDDMPAALAAAAKSGKPILAVFR